jgi:hypothetical protein
MMRFNSLNIAGTLALATTLFTACTDENHAGVLTETESGTTIASLVIDGDGKPVVSARVSLLSSNHVAARMEPIKTATTDKDGKYTIDNISAGDYALQISNTEHTQSAYQTITVEEGNADLQTQSVPEAKLEENASLELKLSAYELDLGDTLCITGTLNCIAVQNKDVKAGTVTIDEIPPMEFTKITLIKTSDEDTDSITQDVLWDFAPGKKLEVSEIQIPVIVSKEDMVTAKYWINKTALDSMIVPVTFKTSIKNPVLLDDNGDTLALYKVENDPTNSKYLTVIPSIDVGTYTFTVAPSETAIQPAQIYKAFSETTPGMNIIRNNSWKAFGSILGISFWVTKDNLSSASDSIYIDTRQEESDVAFSIKVGQEPDLLCAEIYKRTSEGEDDTENNYTLKDSSCQKVLDGERHHYSIFIQSHHIVIAVDGRVTDTKDFSDQFQSIPPITLGNHKLEDFVIYSLGEDVTQTSESWNKLHAWLSAYYAMQK